MDIKMFEIGAKGLVPLSETGKDNLPQGTVLLLNGYNYPKMVIVSSEISKFDGRTMYHCIDLEDFSYSRKEAYLLKFIEDRADDRIQTYITKEIIFPTELEQIKIKAEAKLKALQESQAKASEKRIKKIAKGREIAAQKIPASAKALIIAEYAEDESDSQSDYFGHRTTKVVVLGYSNHTRNIFSEMRKVAGRIPETAELATTPVKPENADEWWTPEDEHRENYSMGGGMYLKNGYRDDTGWSIHKTDINPQNMREDYLIALAEKCVI